MSVMLNLYRSENQDGGGDDTTRKIGPFPFVQVTYGHITCGDDGPEFMLDQDTLFWHEIELVGPPGNSKLVQPDLTKIGYTDLTVNAEQPMEEGDPCPSCDEPLVFDRDEGMVFCKNDWQHG